LALNKELLCRVPEIKHSTKHLALGKEQNSCSDLTRPIIITTGIAFFAECLRHSAKAILHSAKALPSVTLGKYFIGKGFFAECFFRTLGKNFAECQKALGKEKHSAN
jgi:hypothetical protein